ncbi:TPA: HNH endonuclease, partial [Vibrio cholerae]
GAKWDMVPIDRLLELSTYIQDRIEKTVLGKKLKAQGKKSYSTFEEYLAKNCS